MDPEDVFQVGQWLWFDKDTCFGRYPHFGMILGIDKESETIGLAINASSKLENIEKYAKYNNIDTTRTHVKLKPNDSRGGYRFGKETIFDCNRPKIISYENVSRWHSAGRIKIAEYNIDVDKDLLRELKLGVWESPVVEQKYKNMMI